MIISVKIKIESTIENLDGSGLIDGEPEVSVSEAMGTYRYSDGEAFINFNEQTDGGKVHTEIKCLGGTVTVRRDGAIESYMHFSKDESQDKSEKRSDKRNISFLRRGRISCEVLPQDPAREDRRR